MPSSSKKGRNYGRGDGGRDRNHGYGSRSQSLEVHTGSSTPQRDPRAEKDKKKVGQGWGPAIGLGLFAADWLFRFK